MVGVGCAILQAAADILRGIHVAVEDLIAALDFFQMGDSFSKRNLMRHYRHLIA